MAHLMSSIKGLVNSRLFLQKNVKFIPGSFPLVTLCVNWILKVIEIFKIVYEIKSSNSSEGGPFLA